MNTKHETNASLAHIEVRFERALRAEAERRVQKEPPGLAEACRAPCLPRDARQYRSWRWAASAAAALALLALLSRQPIHHTAPSGLLERPASVTPDINRDALYAALPRLPPPARPPTPPRLVADIVVNAPPR